MAHTVISTAESQNTSNNSFFRTMGHALKSYRLGDLLVVKGLISSEQLQTALIEQKRTQERLGKVLVRQGYISAFTLSRKLTQQWCLRVSAVALTFMLQAVNPTSAEADTGLTPMTVSSPIRLASNAVMPRFAPVRLQAPPQMIQPQVQQAAARVQGLQFKNLLPPQPANTDVQGPVQVPTLRAPVQLRAPVTATNENAATIAVAAATEVAAKGTLFGKKETKYSDMKQFKKWSSLFNRFAAKLETPQPETPGIAQWKSEVSKIQHLSAVEKVEYVNNFINQRPYVDDQKVFGKEGYWAANPARFFGQGGDCKDYAITKYATLRALGFSDEQMRVAVVQDKVKRIAHAILIVEVDGKSLVLDNQEKTVKQAANVNRYKPIFAINSSNWWKQES